MTLDEFENPLEDAKRCIATNENRYKGYFRKAHALRGLERIDEAEAALTRGRSFQWLLFANPVFHQEYNCATGISSATSQQ